MKELKPLPIDALAMFQAASKGQAEYDLFLKTLRGNCEAEIKAEFPDMPLAEQLGASRARFVTRHKEVKAELRAFISAL